MEELKPCPFCRSQSVEVWFDLKTPQEAREQNVYCSDCGGRGPTKTEEDWNLTYSDSLTTAAANAWNTRPVEDALRAELAHKDKLIEALRELVEAHDKYLLAADDVAEIKWEMVAGHLVPDVLGETLRKAYNNRESARAALEAVEKESCLK